jgi:hypothetical protein
MPAGSAQNYQWVDFSGSGHNAGILRILDITGNLEW